MKKTLVALAALAATSAFAQNAVSLYGTLDMGVGNIAQSKNGDAVTTRSGAMSSSHDSSRWGLTGKEDLGGGMAAEFKIEQGIGTNPRSGMGGAFVPGGSAGSYTLTNGTNKGNGLTLDNTVLGDRELWIGVTKGALRINAGYGVTAMRNLAVQTDAAGSNNVGNYIAHDVGGYRREGARIDYAAAPGWLISAGVSGNRQNNATGVGPAGEIRNGKGHTYGVQYTQGPINAGYFHDEVTSQRSADFLTTADYGNVFFISSAAATIKNTTSKTDLLAGSYDAGVAKLFAQNYTQKAVLNDGTDTGKGAGKITGTSIGVRVPFGAATVYAQSFSGKDKQFQHTDATPENRKFTGSSFGVRYELSKRTSAYLNSGSLKKETNVAGTIAGDVKYKQTAVGIVHNF